MHAMVDYAFDNGADLNGDGSLDVTELTKLMRDGPPKAYVQTKSFCKIKQSPADIISACDQDADAKLSSKEAHDCVDKFVKDASENKAAHEMVDYAYGAGIAGDDGLLDEEELEEAMEDEHEDSSDEDSEGDYYDSEEDNEGDHSGEDSD